MTSAVSAALRWVQDLMSNMWGAFLKTLSVVLQWLADGLQAVLGWVVDSVLALLTLAASVLPVAPQFPTTGPVPSLISQANYWVPIDTALACIAVVGLFWLGNYLYKLAKFLRGGG